MGNANLLSNTVNSDITPGVYGNATAVSQITIGTDHRITSISNVLIDQSNLDQVENRTRAFLLEIRLARRTLDELFYWLSLAMRSSKKL
jgi:hypothetical protein